MVYVVTSEELFGGQDDIRAFATREAAIEYALELGKRVGLDCAVSSLPDGKFLVVEEQWYGGDRKHTFETYEEAQAYRESLGNVETMIVNL